MSSDSIDEEERLASDRMSEHSTEMIQGSIRQLSSLHERIVSLERTATVADAVNAMIKDRVGAVLIVEGDVLLGLFTERDVLTRVVAAGRRPDETAIGDVMTPAPECLSFDDEMVFALNQMTVGGYRHVPILDADGRRAAVVSMRGVMDHIVEHFSTEVFNLPETPEHGVTTKREGA